MTTYMFVYIYTYIQVCVHVYIITVDSEGVRPVEVGGLPIADNIEAKRLGLLLDRRAAVCE